MIPYIQQQPTNRMKLCVVVCYKVTPMKKKRVTFKAFQFSFSISERDFTHCIPSCREETKTILSEFIKLHIGFI